MGDFKAICPHCEKQSVKLDFTVDGELKKIKGASWTPTLTEGEPGKWKHDPGIGSAVHCKCGRHYFIHSIQRNPIAFEASKTIPSGQHISVYCEKCAAAFIDSEMKCPSCGKQF